MNSEAVAQAVSSYFETKLLIDEPKTSVPDPATADIYQQSYQRYLEHVALVTPIFEWGPQWLLQFLLATESTFPR